MTAKTSASAIARIIQLRVRDRKSLREIRQDTGVGISTISLTLRDYPLTDDELKVRRERTLKLARKANMARAQCHRVVDGKFWEAIQVRAKTTDQRGAIAEAAVIFRMKVWGFVPHIPMCPGGKSDVIVSIPETGRHHRVQIKCVRRGTYGSPHCSLKSRRDGASSVRYGHDDFDFFVGYDLREDICYVFRYAEIKRFKSHLSVSTEAIERWDKFLSGSSVDERLRPKEGDASSNLAQTTRLRSVG